MLALVVRLYHITFPLTGWQSWRQADTASIARNFHEEEQNILYPKIDWRGDTEGYVESEFQIYPFTVSVLYDLFGINDSLGRMLSVIFSLLTVYGIFLLVRKIIDGKAALWSAFIYSILPLNIYFGRAFMPEPLMLMCSVYGIYFFTKWAGDDKTKDYFLSAVFICLAALVKLPALYLGLPLAYLCYKKYGSKFIFNLKVWLFVILVFVPVVLWYYHAHLLNMQTGLSFSIWNAGKDKWGMIGPLLTIKFYNDIFFKSIAERHLTYGAFFVFLWGLFLKREHKLEKLFDWWLIGMIVFIFLAPQAHLAQEYYQLPFTIPASVFIAKVFSKYVRLEEFKKSFSENKTAFSFLIICLVSIFILSFLRVRNFMKSENYDTPVFKLAEDVNLHSEKGDKFITITESNPNMLYLISRKGWTGFPDEISDNYVNLKINKGARFITGEKNVFRTDDQKQRFNKLKDENEVLVENESYYLIKLK